MVPQETFCPQVLIEEQGPVMTSRDSDIRDEVPGLKIEPDILGGYSDPLAVNNPPDDEPFNLLCSWDDDNLSLLGIWGEPATYQDIISNSPSSVGMETYVSTPPFTETSTPEDSREDSISF